MGEEGSEAGVEKFWAERNIETRGGAYRGDVYFFPERLAARLRRISDYPVTLVEAPPGFGKTTAVREYLRSDLPEDAR